MTRKNTYEYNAEIPAELVVPGMLNYKIVMRSGKRVASFPGNVKDEPSAWDYVSSESWSMWVADEKGALELFNPTKDNKINPYPTWRRGFQTSYITAARPGQLILKMTTNDMTGVPAMGLSSARGAGARSVRGSACGSSATQPGPCLSSHFGFVSARTTAVSATSIVAPARTLTLPA